MYTLKSDILMLLSKTIIRHVCLSPETQACLPNV